MLIHLNNRLKVTFFLFFSLYILFEAKGESNLIIKKELDSYIDFVDNKVKFIQKRIKTDNIFINKNSTLGLGEPPGEVLHYLDGNKLLKVEIGYGDCTPQMIDYSYYFFNGQLILKEQTLRQYSHKQKNGDIYIDYDNCVIITEKIYLRNNKVLKKFKYSFNTKTKNRIIINNKYSIRDEQKKIEEELQDFVYLSKLFNRPAFRIILGKGNFAYSPYLLGKEKKVKLSYIFNEDDIVLTLYNQPIKDIKITRNQRGKKIYKKYPIIRKVYNPKVANSLNETELSLEINTTNPESEWWVKIEFEGEEIEIG
ncbi:MAG: hypothetical protein GY830_05730 [Bacteroidetes bacterium]|nr:hypothetical protein [Bacteroidota bacterium]